MKNKEKVIHIEICKSFHEDKYKLRIGDIRGSNESINITKKEVLEAIKDEIDELWKIKLR